MNDDAYYNAASSGGRPKGPLGVDPLHFSAVLFSLLMLFVLYLLLPRGFRVHYFRAYPKRYAWSARSRTARSRRPNGLSSLNGHYPAGSTVGSSITGISQAHQRQFGGASVNSNPYASNTARRTPTGVPSGLSGAPNLPPNSPFEQHRPTKEEIITFSSPQPTHTQSSQPPRHSPSPNRPPNQQPPPNQQQLIDLQQNEEIVISAAMQQLRDPGVLIVAHGSRGKPKTVRLQLTESAITWRTETRKKPSSHQPPQQPLPPPKMGKVHQVPLSNIMYVDVGKQTTALRRLENSGVSESLCFSLLTKEGSLDLEANSPRERDALVSCFSLVLDEVHAQNWRDIYRGPSSDMPSSFDEFETEEAMLEKK